MLYFDWDPQREAENIEKHGISFGAASVALEDPHAIEEEDQVVDGEQRLLTVGMAAGEAVVLVSHANYYFNDDRDEMARIISARRASAGERRDYDELRAESGWNPPDW
jgi:uncharacterized DUF497 family protein